ncbi:MAG: tyrosine-type recombinase/integrase [Solirubrobacteraceae bacterium]
MFGDAAEAWLDGLRAGHITNRSGDPYKPSAIRAYEKELRLRVKPVLGHLRLGEVTTKDVQRLVDGLVKAELAPATIDVALTPLKAMYRRAAGRGDVRVNPTLGIEKPAVRSAAKRIVAPTDAEAMIAALDSDERALWATAMYAGLRRGELIGLRRGDVDLATGVLHVRRGWDMVEGEVAPKSRQGRRKVPIAAVLRDHLDERLLQADDDQHIFGLPQWVSRTNDRARKRWQKRGLPVLTLHEARHTYASFAIAAGLNAKTLSTYMGHATIAITLDLYGHLMPGAEDEATGLLDAYFARQVGTSTVAQTVAHPQNVPA